MGFEPMNGGFANHCVSHFATSPMLSFYQIFIFDFGAEGETRTPTPYTDNRF